MATGTQTYKGLAVPLFGESTIKQVTLGTDVLNVESLAAATGSNLFRASLSSSATLSSGYLQGFYAAVATTGVLSSSCQVNAFAADITLSGTPGVEVSGAYIYIAETGTTVVTALNLNGYVAYLEDMGGAPAYRYGFKAYSASANVASGTNSADATFQSMCAGSTGTWTALLGVTGTTPPEYFLTIDNTTTTRMFSAYSPSDAATYCLRITHAGAVYNIPCVADSCT